MAKLIQVKLGEYRPVAFFDAGDTSCQRDDIVIMEVDRGLEDGVVISDPNVACRGKVDAAHGHLVRVATAEDLTKIANNKKKSLEAISTCVKKINELKLDMQIIKAEYSFDTTKVIFFFAAEGRVDFRELVKDLARIFRVRIELKQIGVRDKAKIIGGYGVCGRELCCSSYMKGFHPLSIKMSKEQGLPLNPTRISGVCGRIKCCMAYEYSVYKEYAKDLPRLGENIATPQGKGRIIDVNILKRYVSVDIGEGRITKVSFTEKVLI